MTITTYLLSKLDFSAPKRWLARKLETPSVTGNSPDWSNRFRQDGAIHSIAQRSYASAAPARNAPSIKPLRVVRVVEQGQARNHVGRMVISGRMADVCAELDRLAACEPA